MTISLYVEHDAPMRLESLSDEQRKISAVFGDGETREYEHDLTIMLVQRVSVDELERA